MGILLYILTKKKNVAIKRLKDSEIEKITELREMGLPIKRISEITNIGFNMVYRVCRNVNVKVISDRVMLAEEIRMMFVNGVSYQEILKQYPEVPSYWVSKVLSNKIYKNPCYKQPMTMTRPTNISIQQILDIRKRYDAGESVFDIAIDYRCICRDKDLVGYIRKICNREMFKDIK